MYDVIVIGGGVAGLNAALILGRARRRVLVLSAGAPRNAPAAHAQGFLTRDGTPPMELLALAREELTHYPSVTLEEATATNAVATDEGFSVALEDGRQLTARRLVLATGVNDLLPNVPGLAELWGDGVHHCPFCHGWEVRDRPWAILGDTPMAYERVALFRGWTSELVVLANGPTSLSEADRQTLAQLGVAVDERRVSGLQRHGDDGVRLRFESGPALEVGAVFVASGQALRSNLAEALGCETYVPGPGGFQFVQTDPVTGETSVPGVYAAGDMIGPMQSLILSAASGARAAYMLSHTLAMVDAEAALLGAQPAPA